MTRYRPDPAFGAFEAVTRQLRDFERQVQLSTRAQQQWNRQYGGLAIQGAIGLPARPVVPTEGPTAGSLAGTALLGAFGGVPGLAATAFSAVGSAVSTLAGIAGPTLNVAQREGLSAGAAVASRSYLDLLSSIPLIGEASGLAQQRDSLHRAEARSNEVLDDFARYNIPLSKGNLEAEVALFAEQEARVSNQRNRVSAAVGGIQLEGAVGLGNGPKPTEVTTEVLGSLGSAVARLVNFLTSKGF